MARNGYTAPDPDNLALQQLVALGLRGGPGGPSPSPSAGLAQAQIATAVADANCTDSTDLAGIYFAIQASYEQQFVSANQQSLNAEVRQYKAAFAAELRKLPALLRTASATLEFPGKRIGPARPKRKPARLATILAGSQGATTDSSQPIMTASVAGAVVDRARSCPVSGMTTTLRCAAGRVDFDSSYPERG